MENVPNETGSVVEASPVDTQAAPKAPKSNKILFAGLLILVLVLLAGGYFLSKSYKTLNPSLQTGTNMNNTVQNIPVKSPQEVTNSASTDTSDTQINQDLQAIDNGLNNIGTNNAAIDQGLNDQQTNLQ